MNFSTNAIFAPFDPSEISVVAYSMRNVSGLSKAMQRADYGKVSEIDNICHLISPHRQNPIFVENWASTWVHWMSLVHNGLQWDNEGKLFNFRIPSINNGRLNFMRCCCFVKSLENENHETRKQGNFENHLFTNWINNTLSFFTKTLSFDNGSFRLDYAKWFI